MFQISLAIFLLPPILIQSKDDWSYENESQWSKEYPYCRGHLQSPIDIHLNDSRYSSALKRMYFERFNFSNDNQVLINNGHTIQLSLKDQYILKDVRADDEDYHVEQLHFHWGHAHDHKHGSEHLLDGKSFPLEMHVVTYSELYNNLQDAAKNVRGLAVVGVFFQISNHSNQYLEVIINALKNISHQGNQTSISEYFNLIALIDEYGISRYFRYDGSLTTPPCYESVIWSVVEEPLDISLEQLQAFQNLYQKNNQSMKNIYRLPHPVGTRKLHRSFRRHKTPQSTSIANKNQYQQFGLVLLSILFILKNQSILFY